MDAYTVLTEDIAEVLIRATGHTLPDTLDEITIAPGSQTAHIVTGVAVTGMATADITCWHVTTTSHFGHFPPHVDDWSIVQVIHGFSGGDDSPAVDHFVAWGIHYTKEQMTVLAPCIAGGHVPRRVLA